MRLKFNRVLVIVCLGGFAAAGVVSRDMPNNAREEVRRNARLMMDTVLAVRAYTVDQVKPHLDKQLEDVFLPQTVPAYAATKTLGHIQKKYRDFGYKEATLNPTHPRDRATDREADIVQQLLIAGPIRRMSQAADKASTGDFDVPDSVLGSSFNRMRRCLEKAMQMIERGAH